MEMSSRDGELTQYQLRSSQKKGAASSQRDKDIQSRLSIKFQIRELKMNTFNDPLKSFDRTSSCRIVGPQQCQKVRLKSTSSSNIKYRRVAEDLLGDPRNVGDCSAGGGGSYCEWTFSAGQEQAILTFYPLSSLPKFIFSRSTAFSLRLFNIVSGAPYQQDRNWEADDQLKLSFSVSDSADSATCGVAFFNINP